MDQHVLHATSLLPFLTTVLPLQAETVIIRGLQDVAAYEDGSAGSVPSAMWGTIRNFRIFQGVKYVLLENSLQ